MIDTDTNKDMVLNELNNVHAWNVVSVFAVHWSQGLWSAGSTDILKYRVLSFRYCVFLAAS